jgi:hypothetical protein
MPDPLSIAAGVSSFIDSNIQASQILYTQIHVVKRAPRDAIELFYELHGIEGTLKKLDAFSAPKYGPSVYMV